MATKVNLIMDQAATFSSSFTVLDILGNSIDFSTYTASSQMRKTYMSVNSYSFSVVANSTGGITLSMTAANTSSLTPGRYVYDLIIEDTSNTITRVVEGIATVLPSVTR